MLHDSQIESKTYSQQTHDVCRVERKKRKKPRTHTGEKKVHSKEDNLIEINGKTIKTSSLDVISCLIECRRRSKTTIQSNRIKVIPGKVRTKESMKQSFVIKLITF